MTSSTEPENLGNSAARSDRGAGARIWIGRVLSLLVTLFLFFDAIGKVTMPQPVMDALLRLGFPTRLSATLAILLLACTLLYAFPRTSVAGAILLTGYLGGAVAIQMRSGGSLFETLFPILIGAVVWAGIFLRENRLGELIPVRSVRRRTVAEIVEEQKVRSDFDTRT
jgi:hypothetical protein